MEIIVIGAGPAGIMASLKASEKGNVTILEKNNMIGKKLLITGKGRCNITNSGSMDELIDAFGKNGRFLYSAFHTFTNTDLMTYFETRGLPLKTERGKRVFPVSDRSLDVVAVLETELKENNIKLFKEFEVDSVEVLKNGQFSIQSKQHTLICDKLIIATGGKSYPKTGSTGDGYKFAKLLGHTVTPLLPYLIPLESDKEYVKQMMGLSLKNVKVSIAVKNKKKAEEFGEMIFTHFGISGPVILTMSQYAVSALKKGHQPVLVSIDLKPALSDQELDRRLLRDFDKYHNKQLKNALDDLLPRKMIPVLIELSGIDENKVVNQISKEERRNIATLLKNFPVPVSGVRPISEAIITAGGISLKEVHPGTMESKIVPNLYFAGEVLDIDGVTGGFNLQAAFSTGVLAGAQL